MKERKMEKIYKLKNNRVRRTYTGGKLLDEFVGNSDPRDVSTPEDWISSVVEARNDPPKKGEGLSFVSAGEKEYELRALIEENPREMIGERESAGVLVKLLDAAERLGIQVHPSKEFAKEYLNSDFGKTECWYIVNTRPDAAVYLGFKEWVTREIWEECFYTQNIEKMLSCLHRFPVKTGEVYLVTAGVAHAIGEGCFLIEIQEPTDFTMRTEKTTKNGTLSPMLIHQGVGEKKMLDVFKYEFLTKEETEKKYKLSPKPLISESGLIVNELVGYSETPCFRLLSAEVTGEKTIPLDDFASIIVLNGNGTLNGEKAQKGDRFFVPFEQKELTVKNLQILICYPPKG